MVDISQETVEQNDVRLRRLIPLTNLRIFDEPYVFSEFTLEEFPAAVDPDVLALIRDDDSWSQLVPGHHRGGELFKIFSFHFPEGEDNSGFVGWLATHLKRKFGTGVFVVCGQNSRQGGIFDYWGCPMEVADDVMVELALLMGNNRYTPTSHGGRFVKAR